MTYSRRYRSIHASLHFLKSAIYSPIGKSFGLDMMHSLSECIENSKKEIPQMSILNEAASRLHHSILAYLKAETAFFNLSDKEIRYLGLSECSVESNLWIQTHFCLYRESQFYELCQVKTIITRNEFPILRKIENHEIALMLDTLDYRYDVAQLFLLRRIAYESEIAEIEETVEATDTIENSEIEETIENTEIVETVETTEIVENTQEAEIKQIKETEDIKETAETEYGSDTSSNSSASSNESIDNEVLDSDE